MSKRSIIDIMKDMDRLEEVEISGELAETLRDLFEHEIEAEELENNEKVAKAPNESFIKTDKGNVENGQSDRV